MFVFDLQAAGVGAALQAFPDAELYHSPAYLEQEAARLGGRPCYWFDSPEPRLLIPLIARPVAQEVAQEVAAGAADGPQDLVSPYGYPGFLSGERSPVAVQRLLRQHSLEAGEQGYVSTFLRLHPLTSAHAIGGSRLYQQVIHGNVVLLDLAESHAALQQAYSQNHRRSLRKLRAEGFKARWRGLEFLDGFIDLYNQTMDRLAADRSYYFEPAYYRALFAAGGCRFVSVEDSAGTAMAGGLFLVSEHTIQYHLGGTRNEALRLAPSKLLFDFVAGEEAGSGRIFVLGGGLGSSADELYRFKTGFSPHAVPFATLRMIHNLERYLALCPPGTARGELGLEGGFFPAYRRPR